MALHVDDGDESDEEVRGLLADELEEAGGPVADAQEPLARLPVGFLLVIFVASQGQRIAYLPEQRTLFACGVPQDLKAALALSCTCLLGRRVARLCISRLLCAVALLVFGVDLFLRLNAGVRLNLDLTTYGLSSLLRAASAGAPSLLLSNLAMAPEGTLQSACALLPLAALLVRASDYRVQSTRPRLAAVLLAAAVALLGVPEDGPQAQEQLQAPRPGGDAAGVLERAALRR